MSYEHIRMKSTSKVNDKLQMRVSNMKYDSRDEKGLWRTSMAAEGFQWGERKAEKCWQWGRVFQALKCQYRNNGRKIQGIGRTVNMEAAWEECPCWKSRILNDLDWHKSFVIFLPSLNSQLLKLPITQSNTLPSYHSAPIVFTVGIWMLSKA